MVFAVGKRVLQPRVRPSIPATSVHNEDGTGGGTVLFTTSMSGKAPEWQAREGNLVLRLCIKPYLTGPIRFHSMRNLYDHELSVRMLLHVGYKVGIGYLNGVQILLLSYTV
jgi:hypothetical protein